MQTPVELVLQNVKLPFVGKLRDYQIEDINRLAYLTNVGLFLDLGLGKTLVSILIACYKLLTGGCSKVYVVMPQSLITQWSSVLTAMELSHVCYRGTPAARRKLDLDVDFVLMSFEIFRGDFEKFDFTEAYLVVDEGTILCQRDNLISLMINGGEKKTIKKVPDKLMPEISYRRFNKLEVGKCLLTATPINRPEDAYGLIKTLNPTAYVNYQQFERIHIAEVDKFNRATEYDNMDLLRDNLLVAATLRYASDHLDLPELIFKNVFYDLAPKHLELYHKLLQDKMLTYKDEVLIDAFNSSAMYNWAQRIIFNPDKRLYSKEPAGFELLGDLLKTTNKALIFACYRETNDNIMAKFKTGGCYGNVTPANQAKFITDFKEGKLNYLTAHVKSGGVGLDLPMCHHIFVPELPRTPRDYRQMCGRCHRSGQKHTVVATNLIARKTLQETIFRKFLVKDDVMNSVINSPMQLSVELTTRISKQDLIKELRGEV